MSYREALEAAGAEVLDYEAFGSYQGDWWARVKLADGRVGWVTGGYGSCSVCDAFESEFGYDADACEAHSWDAKPETCADCAAKKATYQQRLAQFGANYLDGFLTDAEAEAEARKNIEWDSDAETMVTFIQKHSESKS